ncbi:MAG TPA: cell division protein ZapA [Clostridiaceae bacterium]|nr:cell division protein ZapA [Clostridiaceae bacterium]
MKQKKTVAVKIGQMTYHISAEENSQYIEDIAQEADRLICDIRDKNPGLSTTNIAILALINTLDKKAKDDLNNSKLAENAEEYFEKYNQLNANVLSLRETCWELKKELLYYKNLCEVYEDRIDELNQISFAEKITNKLDGVLQEQKPLDKLQTSFAEIQIGSEDD